MEIEKNVFGQELKDGKVVEPTPPAAATTDKKPDVAPAMDIEKNPLVVELRGQIEKIKKEYGGNLTGQRGQIDRLQRQIDALTKKPEDKPKPVFEKIVRVKDLPKEEREAMSDREKQLHDQLADTQEAMNRMAETTAPKPTDGKAADDAAEAFDVSKAVQDEAMKLADGNYTKAQELIGKFNSLDFDLTKITAENLADRVASVVALIPDFKPKQEQQSGNGGPVKTTGTTSTVDAAVAAAVKEREGNAAGTYQL